MDNFLSKILEILKDFKIKPIIYGSFGVSNYLGDFKKFEDIDILIDDEFLNKRWKEFKKLFEDNNFNLINKKEHEFELNGKKVGFALKSILIRDKIINDYSELVKYKNENALTLIPEDFLEAYKFSIKDGYRINTRNKKDKDIIERLEDYINSNNKMKTLKFTPQLVDKILLGEKTSTWRLFDDKNLTIGDKLIFINKETLKEFGEAIVTSLKIKTFTSLTDEDWIGYEKFNSEEEMYKYFKEFYGDKINKDTEIKTITFDFKKKI